MFRKTLFLVLVSHFGVLTIGVSSSTINLKDSVNADCGGVVSGRSGFISYKLNSTYNNNERCIWALENRRSGTNAYLTLQESNFNDDGDFLEIYTNDGGNGLQHGKDAEYLTSCGGILQKSGQRCGVTYPTYTFLVFKSNGSGVGSGFNLTYKYTYTSTPYFPSIETVLINEAEGRYRAIDEYYSEWQNNVWVLNHMSHGVRFTINMLTFTISNNPGTALLYATTTGEITSVGNYSNITSPIQIDHNSVESLILYYRPRHLARGSLDFSWVDRSKPEEPTTVETDIPDPNNGSIIHLSTLLNKIKLLCFVTIFKSFQSVRSF